jgi:hypothetical protein
MSSAVNAAAASVKTVADPNAAYESLAPLWLKSRAACSGERFVKAYDDVVDNVNFTNLLLPFSSSMTQTQYDFYRAEAEWPGVVAMYSRMLVGGLLRKAPQLTFKTTVSEEASNWILNEFGRDDSSLTAFMDEALKEEVETSAAWVFVDYPATDPAEYAKLDREARNKLKPYPVIQKAESIINWRTSDNKFGKQVLDRVNVRGFRHEYTDENQFHPNYIEVVYVHEINASGKYWIRVFERSSEATSVPVVSGQVQTQTGPVPMTLVKTIEPLVNGEALTFIPGWPLNGSIEPSEPLLIPLIDKEVALYNKISRRNHLLYGAATYTPVLASDMSDDEFIDIVDSGLGSWIKIGREDTLSVLDTPTAALKDMEATIAAGFEEMAKLGIRMLTPETDQSGVALELRNAAQTAQIGTLNTRVSDTLRQIIVFMVNWRYDLKLTVSDVEFSLSSDFNPTPMGDAWLRLATEWYQAGIIPRSVWILLLKHNDMLPADYDDEKAQAEINADELVITPKVQANLDYEANMSAQMPIEEEEEGELSADA